MRPIALILALLAGCATTEDRVAAWVGEPITQYIEAMRKPESYATKINWQEQKYTLRSGNWVFVSPYAEDCLIHWEVDRRGIIVNYRLAGGHCW